MLPRVASFIVGIFALIGFTSATPLIRYGTIAPAPREINVLEGQSLLLICSSDDPTATVRWSTDVEGVGPFLGGRLFIPQLRRRDSGRYHCSQHRGTTTSIQINVLYATSRPKISGPSKVTQGSDVQLTCTAEGNPPPSYSWVLRGSGTRVATGPEFNGTNLISPLHVRCEVESSMIPTQGDPATTANGADFKVDILRPASIYDVYDDYWGDLGSSVMVECKAATQPAGDIYWTRTQDNRTFGGPRLVINPLTVEDAGLYTCHSNKTLSPDNGPPVISTAEKSTRIRIFEPGNKWKCYFFNSSELIRLKNEKFPEGIKPEWIVCEQHPGFVFNHGFVRMTPGCTPCHCCQPDSGSPLIQAPDDILAPAVAVGWGLDVLLIAVLLFLSVKIWRNSKLTTTTKVFPPTMIQVEDTDNKSSSEDRDVNQTRPRPHQPAPKPDDTYLEVYDDTSTNDMRFIEGRTNLPQLPTDQDSDDSGYIRPRACSTERQTLPNVSKHTDDKNGKLSLQVKSDTKCFPLPDVRESEL